MSDLKIKKLECMFLYYPFEQPIGNSLVWFEGKYCNLIKITTDDGIVGHGDAYGFDSDLLRKAMNELFPYLVNFSFEKWEELLGEIRTRIQGKLSPYFQGSIESAFNLAYWDIKGKMENKSICQLFGAAPRKDIPVYGTGLFYRQVDNYMGQLPYFMKEIEGFVEKGYKSIKMKAGRYSIEQECWLIQQIIKELPDSVDIMVDVNCGMNTFEETVELARRLQDMGVKWLEEPFAPTDYHLYGRLASAANIPISAGENEYTLEGFKKLIDSGVAIIQPELSLCGGFSQVEHLKDFAQKENVGVTPHVWGSGFMYGATLQFYSLLGDFVQLPYECTLLNDPIRDHCFKELKIENGKIDTPSGPGLGVEIDEEHIKPYLI